MAHNSQHAPEPSLASLIGGIINDAKNLLLHELTMVKYEVQDEVRKTKAAAVSLGIGIGVAAVGGILLTLMLVHLLDAFTDIPLWGCYGIVGGVFAVLGGVLLARGRSTASAIDVVPQQTVETMKENVKWIREQTTSDRV